MLNNRPSQPRLSVSRTSSTNTSTSKPPIRRPYLPSKLSSAQTYAITASTAETEHVRHSDAASFKSDGHSVEDLGNLPTFELTNNTPSRATHGIDEHILDPALLHPSRLGPRSNLPLPLTLALATEKEEVRSDLPTRYGGGIAPDDKSRRASGIRAPSIAPALTEGKAADFFPWTGDSSEDILNENVVRSGYADKPAGSIQSESHTARPTLWPSLKNKSGLPLLSTIFIQVMDKRQALGRCTAPSTFKPPPRVTLTDTKREAWLRDLATPEVPLRRLSRTIPHGIRGKTLLDQCLGKHIPLARAVWLAKCVGANELRAFRRKGVSGAAAYTGETKWVKEWTVFVEQFLEAVIDSCGQPNWNVKVQYAIRLVTALFSEKLLDNEHFFDWLLASFKKASVDRLPMWIVLAQIYWRYIVAQQNRGRRLANVLLLHRLAIATGPLKDIYQTILDKVDSILVSIVFNHDGCLIALEPWTQHRAALQSIFSGHVSAGCARAIESVIQRNDNLHATIELACEKSETPQLRMIRLLDLHDLQTSMTKLAAQCAAYVPQIQARCDITLRWASSRFRDGTHRSYCAAALLHVWRADDYDMDAIVLTSFTNLATDLTLERRALHKVVAELLRCQDISFGAYLQWLISVGALSGIDNEDTALLSEVQIEDLSSRVLNLRNTLMQRLKLGSDDETARMEDLKAQISHVLNLETSGVTRALSAVELQTLSGSTAFSLARWLRLFTEQLLDRGIYKDADFPIHISLCHALTILEKLEVFSEMPPMMKIALASTNPAVLAVVADFTNMHAEIFNALGVLEELCILLEQRQRVLRNHQPLDRTFLLSLTRLLNRVPANPIFFKALNNDLNLCEQQGSAAACSPASDSMATSPTIGTLTDADIDQILASGNTMDEQLMGRLFSAIVERAVKTRLETADTNTSPSEWLPQLRLFDPQYFEKLCQNLLAKLLGNATFEQITALLTVLVGSYSLEIEVVLNALVKKMHAQAAANQTIASRLALSGLQLLLSKPSHDGLISSPDSIRYRLAQKQICRDNVQLIFELSSTCLTSNKPEVYQALQRTNAQLFVKRAIVQDSGFVLESLCSPKSTSVSASSARLGSARLLGDILKATGQSREHDPTSTGNLENILEDADGLAQPFSQIALKLLVDANDDTGMSEISDDSSVFEALKAAIARDNPLMPRLLPSLPSAILTRLHTWAYDVLIDQAVAALESEYNDQPEAEHTESLLHAAQITKTNNEASQIQHMTAVTDRLQAIDEFICNMGPLEACLASLRFSLESLLRLAVIHCSTSSLDPAVSYQTGRLLCLLCNLLCRDKLQMHHKTSNQVFDVASLLASHLSSEQVLSVARHMPSPNRSDRKVSFILGLSESPNNWLALASRVQPNQAGTSPTPIQGAFPPPARPGQTQLSTPRSFSQPSPLSHQSLSPSTSHPPPNPVSGGRSTASMMHDVKYTPFTLRQWEILPDPTPNMGDNDTSLSLGLFAARKVS